MRASLIAVIGTLLLSACGSTPTQQGATTSAEQNQMENSQPVTKVCKEQSQTVGSRLAKKVCK